MKRASLCRECDWAADGWYHTLHTQRSQRVYLQTHGYYTQYRLVQVDNIKIAVEMWHNIICFTEKCSLSSVYKERDIRRFLFWTGFFFLSKTSLNFFQYCLRRKIHCCKLPPLLFFFYKLESIIFTNFCNLLIFASSFVQSVCLSWHFIHLKGNFSLPKRGKKQETVKLWQSHVEKY